MKRILFLTAILFWTTAQIFAQITNPSVNIRFYNKKIYTPDSQIQIMVELENETETPIAFYLADNKLYNVNVKVASLKGVLCDPSDYYLKTMAIKEPYQYKEVVLQPNERYSFRLRLNDYVTIDKTESYEVTVSFYGNLVRNAGEAAVSNTLYLNINEGSEDSVPAAALKPAAATSAAAPQRVRMAPDKAVAFTIDAMINRIWDDLFLYINLESLYLKNADRKEQYLNRPEEIRKALLSDYRTKITEGNVEKEFVLIPSRYEITLTTYNETNAQVTVLEYFDRVTFTEKKEYKYRLEKQDSIWMIEDYIVRNLGIDK